jgi:hypothetical protein
MDIKTTDKPVMAMGIVIDVNIAVDKAPRWIKM